MKPKSILFISLVILLVPTATGELVHVAEINGDINSGTAQYIHRVIEDANQEGIDLIIIKLETPGGLLKATQDIVRDILDSKVEIVVYVYKKGGWAYSAGTYILMASDIAAVHPDASFGAAQPIPPDNKTVNAMAIWMETLAETNHRNSSLAKRFVTENIALSGNEALERGIIEYTPESLEQLLMELNLTSAQRKEIKPSFQEGFFSTLSHPQMISLLFLIGVLGIIYVFKTGELELSPIPVIALLLALWGIGTIQFSWMGIFLIIVGIALLIAESLQPGFGIFGITGGISILLGILTIDAEPFFTSRLFDEITMFVLGVTVCTIGFFVIAAKKVVESMHERIKTGPEALIGKKATVIEELNPRGMVKIDSETWSAVSINGEFIEKDETAEVVEVRGSMLYVQKKNA